MFKSFWWRMSVMLLIHSGHRSDDEDRDVRVFMPGYNDVLD